jgi:hypothetical protein
LDAAADLRSMSAAASADSTRRVICETSIGEVEVLFDERSGIFSVYHLDRSGRPVAAAFDNWQFRDLAEVLRQDVGMPPAEAEEIASTLAERWHVDVKRPKFDETGKAVATSRPRGIFYVLLAGGAAVAAMLILWTTLQAFL